MSITDTAAFTRCWEDDGPRVAAYVRRHVPPDEIQDVVAETFLAAWRRRDDVTDPPIAWLVGTARKVIGNHRRARGRRDALRTRLVLLDAAAATAADAGLVATDRIAAIEALASLAEPQREALLLLAWDGLTPEQAASVLGLRPGTFRVRTHRARTALADSIDPRSLPPRAPTLSEGGRR